jgi:hypothetical protein
MVSQKFENICLVKIQRHHETTKGPFEILLLLCGSLFESNRVHPTAYYAMQHND